jgi:hypothetical protein
VQTPAVSRTLRLRLSKELSGRVLGTCRQAGITFGHALSVLAQLAHARVLHRLYAQGSLSETDWTHRIKQPMHQSGPFNLRAHLDKEWLATGGADRVCVAISFYRTTLPALPVARLLRDNSQVLENPPFQAMLSRGRFLHRCRMVKKQTSAFLTHPLLPEFSQIMRPARAETSRLIALDWRAQLAAATEGIQTGNRSLGLVSQGSPDDEFVLSNACSTVGDVRIYVTILMRVLFSDRSPMVSR